MESEVSQSLSAGSGPGLRAAKRPASEEPESASDAKRVKTSHESTNPDDLESPDTTPRIPFPDKPAVLEERNGEIQFRVVNNDRAPESMIVLTGLKCLFQKQLPKMPKDYIARLVYDRNHLSIAIVKMPLEVIGGITYRAFRDRKFAEIVFCAVSSDQQVKGYGAHLMAHLKDYVKATSPVMHFLTYADNYATGKDDVPDYYNVIISPMDLSTALERLERDHYTAPKNLCAVRLEKYMWSLIKEIPEWFDLLEEE
ncbi:hypothetical protein G7Z17_g7913 [Cylindrodendrum hubeiense]|uniref:Histone acetyltransferase n=1 Tax=Cylindrodendrum hubeiense TaxID=595255 RepID=A0A9P5H252_9HYPO|nr:hypothetical protein G7Z17_g7913 [Cylindrodendrum hubeiense]